MAIHPIPPAAHPEPMALSRAAAPAAARPGYAGLYARLVEAHSRQPALAFFSVFLAVGFLAAVLLAAFFPTLQAPLDGVEIVTRLLVLLGVVIFFLYFVSLVFIVRQAGGDSPAEVARLAARLLLAEPRPHSAQAGLGYDGLRHLKRVAEIEQGAASWRGNYVNILIVGMVTYALGGGAFALRGQLAPAGAPAAGAVPGQPALPALVAAAWLLLALALAWVFGRLFQYLRRFLGSEQANRLVLLACEEALSLLDAYGLAWRSEFKFHEKRALAEHLGCRLAPAGQLPEQAARRAVPLLDPKGQAWYLVDAGPARSAPENPS